MSRQTHHHAMPAVDLRSLPAEVDATEAADQRDRAFRAAAVLTVRARPGAPGPAGGAA